MISVSCDEQRFGEPFIARGTTNEGHGSEGIAFLLSSRPRYILTASGVGGQSSRNIHQRNRGDEEAVTDIPRARGHPPDRGKHDPGRAEGEREAEEVGRKEVSQVSEGPSRESMGGDEMSQDRPVGRPVTWTPEKRQEAIDKILSRIATSRDSLRTICKEDKELPNVETFFGWLRNDKELNEQYAHAKESQVEVLGEEMLDISDDGANDYMEKVGPDGSTAYVLNGEHVQRSRLRIETRKWLMGKLRPKKYGELVRQEITGKDGGPVNISITPTQASIL